MEEKKKELPWTSDLPASIRLSLYHVLYQIVGFIDARESILRWTVLFSNVRFKVQMWFFYPL